MTERCTPEKQSEYCVTKLYVWGEHLDPTRVTKLLAVESDKQREPNAPGLSVKTRGMWRRSIDDDKRAWELLPQLEHWCDFLVIREHAIRTLQAEGNEFEIDCYINEGPIVIINLPSPLLMRLGNLGTALSLGFYDTWGGKVTDP